MTNDATMEVLADLYQVLGAVMGQWKELGIKVEHMDALIEVQRMYEQWKAENP